MKLKVGLYARVSTKDQHADIQLIALVAYAKSRGFKVADKYVDVASGAKERRPALDRMLADARRRRLDAIACVKLDRLARSVRHLTNMATEFEALDVSLMVLDQGIDTTTPAGRLLFHTLAAIAEFERDLIRERTRAGMMAARKRGKRLGRPWAVRGPDTFCMEQLLGEGGTYREVGKKLGVSATTVLRTARRLKERSASA